MSESWMCLVEESLSVLSTVSWAPGLLRSYHESTERLARLWLACARARCLAVAGLHLFRWTGKPTFPWLWVQVNLLSLALCLQHWGYFIRSEPSRWFLGRHMLGF